ncbi:cathepsin L-like proteinase [Lepeophtheirus salmonis]|uniref:cathepsin L-like proteinase n=1 Tax=Lepeophtheirus salmonis TaxID=72036 RepID=UPI001AE48076|nr:zingipain-2-like [Lepeophtheirus salmonis]
MKFKWICLLVAFVSYTEGKFSSPTQREIQEFETFVKKYSKSFHNRADRSLKLKVFVNNLREIEEHNDNPERTWDMGINEYSDLTDEEFEGRYMGYTPISSSYGIFNRAISPKVGNIEDLPKNVDWREKGVITDAKSQGACGSCWVFTSVQQIESYVALENNVPPPLLSAQQITSCSANPYKCGGAGGCDGAVNQIAYMYAQLYGIATEEEYPYTSGTTSVNGECLFNTSSIKGSIAHVRGYEVLPSNDMYSVMEHLATKGPLGASVYASRFRNYKSGVLNGCDFDSNININHAIQLIGYGTDNEIGPYWLIRNSWGPTWGDNGVAKLKRYTTTKCGINNTPEFGIKCEGDGIVTQKVCGNCGVILNTDYPIGVSMY